MVRYKRCLLLAQDLGSSQHQAVALGALGDVAEQQNELEDANSYLTQALAIDRELRDHSGEAYDLRHLGELADRRGELEEAEKYFDQALAVDRELQDRPGESYDLRWLGEITRRRGQSERSQAWFAKALSACDGVLSSDLSYEDRVRASENKVEILFSRIENYDAALSACEQALQLNSASIVAFTIKALSLVQVGKPEKALAPLERALSLTPANDLDWYWKGRALLSAHRYRDAIDTFDSSLELDPYRADSWYAKATALELLGQDENAKLARARATSVGYEPDAQLVATAQAK